MRILTGGDRLGIALVGLLGLSTLGVCDRLQAQTVRDAESQVSVPLVGCASDGQTGPLEAPESGNISVGISRDMGRNMAYYKAFGVGVLAPRGWHCFGTYGSGGDTLLVSAGPMEALGSLSDPKDLSGPAVRLDYTYGEGSGGISVATILARVFPPYRAQAINAMNLFDVPESERIFGPYPKDTLTYRGKKIVEFTTPASADGLGTCLLPKNDSPIHGVVILLGKAPDVLHLSVRLPAAMARLAPAITKQLEFDAAHLPPE